MTPESIRTLVAVHILEVWLLTLGFQPTGYFDPEDPECVRDFGPHRIYTIQAYVPYGVSFDRFLLLDHLQQFLNEQTNLSGDTRFKAYNFELYESPYCGNYISASIEHTA